MFNNIIGNEKVIEGLKKSVKNNKISHSYLFLGIEGIGKKLIAKEFAKMILCTGNNKYCDSCKSCLEFDSSNNPDFNIIEPDGTSLKIDQIRYLQNKVVEKPIISDRKVYIINNSDKMTTEAQNCLLKTLEEPPEFVTIILIGSNENAFLSTIKSRCMILHFNKIEDDKIQKFLEEKYSERINDDILISAFQGSIGNALKVIEKQEIYQKIESVIYNLDKKDKIDIIKMCDFIYKSKDEKNDILDYINIILIKNARKNHKFAKCIKIVEDTKSRLQLNSNYDMSIDYMIFNLWEIVNSI